MERRRPAREPVADGERHRRSEGVGSPPAEDGPGTDRAPARFHSRERSRSGGAFKRRTPAPQGDAGGQRGARGRSAREGGGRRTGAGRTEEARENREGEEP